MNRDMKVQGSVVEFQSVHSFGNNNNNKSSSQKQLNVSQSAKHLKEVD